MNQRSAVRSFFTTTLPALGLASVLALGAATSPARAASWDAFTKGSMGPVVDWPLIPIHVILLPDGRLLSYGTDAKGQQTGQFIYDVWDPKLGSAAASHLVLPNTTGTDIFCSAQVIVPSSGAVLLTGGDKTVNGVRNYSVNDANLFDYRSSALYQAPQAMRYVRWYPTVVTLASGQILVLGGRASPTELSVPTPELYTEGQGWRTLEGATSDDAYGARNWSYPRAWQAPNGKVFVMTIWGGTYYLDPAASGGAGAVTATPLTVPTGDVYLPSVMYAPGKILALRQFNRALIVDINGAQPTSTAVTGVGQDRYHGSATVLADGKVYVSGGSIWSNVAFGVAYAGKIWDPATRRWTPTATARKMRLYHSVSLLLPDATVLTAGGGAPGPATNLNAEIYTPPYLYKQDWSGTLAARPAITDAPTAMTWKQSFKIGVSTTGVSRVTLVKTGSATHTVDFDQRFMPLAFTANGKTLTVTAPAAAEVAPPGYYMLFVFDAAGVPSIARILRLG